MTTWEHVHRNDINPDVLARLIRSGWAQDRQLVARSAGWAGLPPTGVLLKYTYHVYRFTNFMAVDPDGNQHAVTLIWRRTVDATPDSR